MMVPRPLIVDAFGDADDARTPAAHVFDDRRRVMNEERPIVDRFLDLVEDERRRGDCRLETRGVYGNAFLCAEARVTVALKNRSRKDKSEVDVEEDGANRHATASLASGRRQGPATAITARAG